MHILRNKTVIHTFKQLCSIMELDKYLVTYVTTCNVYENSFSNTMSHSIAYRIPITQQTELQSTITWCYN